MVIYVLNDIFLVPLFAGHGGQWQHPAERGKKGRRFLSARQ
jgi:hypothetical protein